MLFGLLILRLICCGLELCGDFCLCVLIYCALLCDACLAVWLVWLGCMLCYALVCSVYAVLRVGWFVVGWFSWLFYGGCGLFVILIVGFVY